MSEAGNGMADSGGDPDDNNSLIREALGGVVDAVAEEIRAASADPTTRHALRRGRMMGRANAAYLWSFEADGLAQLQPETTGALTVETPEAVTATVVAMGDFDLVLAINDDIGPTVNAATFVAQPLFILEALRTRLAQGTEQLMHADMVAALLDLEPLENVLLPSASEPRPSDEDDQLDDEYEPDEEPDLGLSAEQLAAAEHAMQDGLRFVWGPPGTGKTSTLAATVRTMAEFGRRVLVVAHSNAAVDVAMVRIAEMMKDDPLLDEGRILRVGTPQLPEARQLAAILPAEVLSAQSPELAIQRRELEAERRRLSGAMRQRDEAPAPDLAAQLARVRAAMAELDKRAVAGQRQLIADAMVVGCTLSKLVVDQSLWDLPRDAVVLDEASMASLPFVFALALGGPRTLACFGDFRQLPPVAISHDVNARHWLGRDVFMAAGVVDRIERSEVDPRLAMLRTQYRMGEVIAGAVSEVAYYGRLATHIDAKQRADRLALNEPVSGTEALIVDISALGSVCTHDAAEHSYSRFNPTSAGVVTVLAQQLAANPDLTVGVITPYRAQAQLLHAALRAMPNITAATVHRFQGSECDAVLVDLVDAAPMNGPSQLTGADHDVALRLLNVGISRARGKLLVVVDLEFLTTTSPPSSPTRRFIDQLVARGASVVAAAGLLGRSSDTAEWHETWWSALLTGAGSTRSQRVEVHLPSHQFGGALCVETIESMCRQGLDVAVHAPASVAGSLEHLDAGLHLRTTSPAPLALLGDAVLFGGASPERPTVLFKGHELAAVARRLALNEEPAWRS